MPTSYTSLLGLALPVTGELSGTWGDTVNNYITSYVDASVAGAQTISGSQTAVTLSTTNGTSLSQAGSGATGSAQYQIINCTGNPGGLLTITAPAASKSYIVINGTSTNQSVKIVGAGPTTGVTLVAGEKAIVAWNGSDFVKVASSVADGVTSVGGTGTVNGITLTGTVTSTGNLTLGGTLSNVSLSSQVTGTLPVANGGTGQTTYTDGQLLIGNSTGNTLAKSTLTAGSGVTITNGSGTITISATGSGGDAVLSANNAFTGANTFYNATGQTFGTATSTQDGIILAGRAGGSSSYRVTLQPGTLTASRTVTLPDANINFTTGLGVAQGGTGATSLTANNVLLGNGTSALQVVAPGTSGNVLTSNGTTWTSAAPAGGAWTFISSQTASSSATISFTGISSTYDVYAIQLVRVVPDIATFLQLLTSTDNGSFYASGNYGFASIRGDGNNALNNYGSTGIGTSTYTNLTPNNSSGSGAVSTTANVGVSGWVYLWKPSESAACVITYDLVFLQSTTNFVRIAGCAAQNTAADVDAVQFRFYGGLLSTGTFRMYGIKNS